MLPIVTGKRVDSRHVWAQPLYQGGRTCSGVEDFGVMREVRKHTRVTKTARDDFIARFLTEK